MLAAGDVNWRSWNKLGPTQCLRSSNHALFLEKMNTCIHQYEQGEWYRKVMVLVLVWKYSITSGLRDFNTCAHAYVQVLLMTLMTLTGNYGFYPLLTLTLCLSLIDDTWLNSWTGSAVFYKGRYTTLPFSLYSYRVLV